MRDGYPIDVTDLEQLVETAVNDIISARAAMTGRLFADVFEILSPATTESRQWPSLSILIPIALNYVLLGPDMEAAADLRSLYARLLASAMEHNSAGDVHPSFAYLLSQMSEQDAQIVRMSTLEGDNSWPALEVRHPNPTMENYRIVGHVYGVGSCGNPSSEIVSVSVANLVRLGIFEEDWTSSLSEERTYRWIEERAHVECMPRNDVHYTTHRGVVSLTAFGSRFVGVCVRGPRR